MKKIICTAGVLAVLLLGATACASAAPAPAGTWGDPDAKGTPSLEFDGSREGDYSGTDGCNLLGGSYTIDGDVIDLGAMHSTLMYCEGVDTWLTQARTATINGGTMTLLDERGAQIGTLERHGK